MGHGHPTLFNKGSISLSHEFAMIWSYLILSQGGSTHRPGSVECKFFLKVHLRIGPVQLNVILSVLKFNT